MVEGSLRQYLLKTLQDLLQRDDHLTLPLLIRARPVLENLLTSRLLAARSRAYTQAFQQQLFADDGRVCVSLDQYTFRFPKDYPVNQLYDGRQVFDKYYCRDIGAMSAEEVQCALALEQVDAVMGN